MVPQPRQYTRDIDKALSPMSGGHSAPGDEAIDCLQGPVTSLRHRVILGSHKERDIKRVSVGHFASSQCLQDSLFFSGTRTQAVALKF